jgi:hypothetical protein
MAEILVKAISTTHPTQDHWCYKLGDPVVVMDNDHPWGALEGLPNFWIIKIPDATIAEVQHYIDMLYDQPTDLTPSKRRRWYLDNVKVPQHIWNELESTGTLTGTKAQLDNFMTDKKGPA